jgi:hypothetical protein
MPVKLGPVYLLSNAKTQGLRELFCPTTPLPVAQKALPLRLFDSSTAKKATYY